MRFEALYSTLFVHSSLVFLIQIYCFRMYVLFSPLASFSAYLLIYMPFIAQMAGLSQSEGALLMTISGCMDLLARLVLSLLADKKWFSKTKASRYHFLSSIIIEVSIISYSSLSPPPPSLFLLPLLPGKRIVRDSVHFLQPCDPP